MREWDVACSYGATTDGSEDRAAGWGIVARLMRSGRGEPGPGLGIPRTQELGKGSLVLIKPHSLCIGDWLKGLKPPKHRPLDRGERGEGVGTSQMRDRQGP